MLRRLLALSLLASGALAPVPQAFAQPRSSADARGADAPGADAPGADARTLCLDDVSVLPMATPEVLPGRRVVVQHGRIRAVEPTAAPRACDARVDGRGLYVMPGLWDAHVHAWDAAGFAEAFLAHGIVGVRDAGSALTDPWPGATGALGFREAVRSGRVRGPHVFTAGLILDGGPPERPAFGFFRYLATPDDARRWVDSLAARGVDFVKVYSSLDAPTFAALAARARQRGLRVAGHVPFAVGTRQAVQQGLASIEHLTDLALACASTETAERAALVDGLDVRRLPPNLLFERYRAGVARYAAAYDEARCAALARETARRGAVHAPSLVVLDPERRPDGTVTLDPALVARTPAPARSFVQGRDTLTADGLARARAERAFHERLVRLLHVEGVTLLAGADSPNPGVLPGRGLHDELVRLVQAGLSPYAALRAATVAPAAWLGRGRTHGILAPGRAADLVVLGANPMEQIHAVRDVRAVVLGGRYLPSDTLEAALRRATR